MPADPNNPFPSLDQVTDFFKRWEEVTDKNAWWNYVDHHLLEWDGMAQAAINSGLFYHAAANSKTVYSFTFTNFAARIPENSKRPVEKSQEVIKELDEKIKGLGLHCVEKHLRNKDSKEPVYRLYCTQDAGMTYSIFYENDGMPKVSLKLRSTRKELVEKVRDFCGEYLVKEPDEAQLYAVSETDEGRMTLASIGRPGIDIQRENYTQSVLDGFDYVIEQLNTDKPFGRLVILHGPPGTGKTYLIRSLFNQLNLEKSKFIFFQPELLFRYSVSSITRLLIDAADDGDSLVLVIEDADDCLVPRQSDNMVAISKLLNLADGFIGNMLDVRIIATTNADKIHIDPALKRAGRLCRIIDVGYLSPDEAARAYHKISGDDGDVPLRGYVSLADVYAAALGKDADAEKKDNVVGFR